MPLDIFWSFETIQQCLKSTNKTFKDDEKILETFFFADEKEGKKMCFFSPVATKKLCIQKNVSLENGGV